MIGGRPLKQISPLESPQKNSPDPELPLHGYYVICYHTEMY
jgi:hypothetical protein